MLFLRPPYHLIRGVAVFADHAREDVFHYAPARPRLTHEADPATGVDVPRIQLLKYRGEAGTGGFLNFSVDLGIEEERLEEVRREWMRLQGLRDAPIASPMLFEDGAVKLVILGRQSGEDGALEDGGADDDGAERPRFVLEATHHSKPALYGENRAIFSVALDENGVTLIEQSLAGELLPIGIVYSLVFYALRPAFRVKVSADWERVQRHFEERFTAGVLFSSIEIGEIVDELVDERAITIEADTFLPEGEEDGSWIGHRDQALSEFKDMVTESFFEPSVGPLAPPGGDFDDELHAASQVGMLIASGGTAGSTFFSYRKIDLTRIDRKSINLEMNERVSVRRSIHPQAHLSGLFRTLRDAAGRIELERFVTEVDLDDEWFRRRTLTAHALVDFADTHIEALNVSLRYGDRLESLRLTEGSPTGTRSWPSLIEAGAMRRELTYDYSVSFSGVDVSERPGTLQAPPRQTLRDEQDIAPQNDRLFFVDRIIVGAAGFPWERYPSVEVQLRYEDAANGIDLERSFVLRQTDPEIQWRRFRIDPERSAFSIRRVFHAADHRDRVLDWAELDQERVIIRDPVPARRTVSVVPSLSWALVSTVFVELDYQDLENAISRTETLLFTDTDAERGPKTFAVALADPAKRFVRYRATILLADHRQVVVPTSETQDSLIVIRLGMQGHRVIEVRSPEGSFEAAGIDRLIARLVYEDLENALSVTDEFTFDAPGQTRFFEFDYARAERSAYRLTTTEIFANGLRREREHGLMIENPLRLRLG